MQRAGVPSGKCLGFGVSPEKRSHPVAMITFPCTVDLHMFWTAGIALKVVSVDYNGQNGNEGQESEGKREDIHPLLS